MTILEKRQAFIKKIQEIPDDLLDKAIAFVENISTKKDLDKADFEKYLKETTLKNKAWKMKPLDAVKQYGSLDKDGRQGLYYTMSLIPNSAGLFLEVLDTEISVRHISGQVVATWQLQTLADRFLQKMPALVFVSAFTEERDTVKYFHYYRTQLMKGTSPELLADQFREGNILVNLRLHDKGTRVRNHGTGFRTYAN
jgi:uncharacterized protein YfeS